jgi:hypothetical protein
MTRQRYELHIVRSVRRRLRSQEYGNVIARREICLVVRFGKDEIRLGPCRCGQVEIRPGELNDPFLPRLEEQWKVCVAHLDLPVNLAVGGV